MVLDPWCLRGIIGALLFARLGHGKATKLLESNGLIPCSSSSVIKTNDFKMTLTPGNATLTINFDGELTYSGKILMDIDLLVYGYTFLTTQVDLCDYDLSGFCPMTPENLTLPYTTLTLSDDVISSIPSIAYTVPDIDAVVRVNIISKSTNQSVTCLKARVVNSATVYQAGVGWALAVIVGLSLFTSAFVSILGYDNVAAQVSFRTLIFLGFMQSQAIAGLAAVEFTPLIQNWTQNFQWTMSIVHAAFLHDITTWFQRATGGTASDLFAQAGDISISLLRRSTNLLRSSTNFLNKRSESTSDNGAEVLLHGIIRMGYIAGIEPANIFMTGYLLFYFIAIVMVLIGMALKFGLPAVWNKIYETKAYSALNTPVDWQTSMREIIYRVVYLGYQQVCVFSMWELSRRDSVAEVVLAITIWLAMTIILGNATFEGFRSVGSFRYIRSLRVLNKTLKWSRNHSQTCQTRCGYLYVFYKPGAYYFATPLLLYTVSKGMVIAFTQHSPTAQAIALLVVEATFLVCTAVVRPYVNKKANGFAITAATLNLVNGLFILIFTNIFDQPDLMTGIMALLFFFYNALFTLVLLLFLLIGLFYASQLKEPASGWQHLSQNRASVQYTPQPSQSCNRGSIELRSYHEETTIEQLRSSPLHRSPMEDMLINNEITFDSRHSAIPPSPFAHPVEPSSPILHRSLSVVSRV